MKLLIYGSGGLGREVMELAIAINEQEKKWEEFIFVDDVAEDGEFEGYKRYRFNSIEKRFNIAEVVFCIAVGEPKLREALWKRVKDAGYTVTSLIHPSAVIGARVSLGQGIIIKNGVSVSCDVKIGYNVYLGENGVIGHDVVIGDNCSFSALHFVGGNTVIKENVYIGAQAGIRDRITIGKESIIGMCACIVSDVPDNVVMIGNPGRFLRDNTDGQVFKR